MSISYGEPLTRLLLLESNFILCSLVAIGEAGSTLSGGQKARVALARAVYQDKPIYLFDDIMSAVDRNVANHIYQNCIMKYLLSKTRILCTHHTQYLVNADHIIVMEDGAITEQGIITINFDAPNFWCELVSAFAQSEDELQRMWLFVSVDGAE